MTRSENEVDQIVFRWDSENLTGSTGFGPVAWSGPREEAENLFRTSGPVLRASGEETRPALIRLQRRSEVMLIHRAPLKDADGGTSVLCHALVGSPELLEPATCLGLHAWNWEGAAMDGARVRGQLPVIPERILVPATGRGQGELDGALEHAREELHGMVAELLRHPEERFTVLDERGDTASLVLWGLYSMFGAFTGRRWTFATHDTAELTALRFVFVGRWAGAASRNADRRRVDPRERVGDRAEEVAARLVDHHLRGVAAEEGQEYAVGSALHGASSVRGSSLLETAVRALDVLDRRHPGGPRPAPAAPVRQAGPPAPAPLPPAPLPPEPRRKWGWGRRAGADDPGRDGGPPRGEARPGPEDWFRPEPPEHRPAGESANPPEHRPVTTPRREQEQRPAQEPSNPPDPRPVQDPLNPPEHRPTRESRRPPEHLPGQKPPNPPGPRPVQPPRRPPEYPPVQDPPYPPEHPPEPAPPYPPTRPAPPERAPGGGSPAAVPSRLSDPAHPAPGATPSVAPRQAHDPAPSPYPSTRKGPETAPTRPPHRPAPGSDSPRTPPRAPEPAHPRHEPPAPPGRQSAPQVPDQPGVTAPEPRPEPADSPAESGGPPPRAPGPDAYPRPDLPLVAPVWTGRPVAGGRAWAAVRPRGKERETETGLLHKLPAARTVDEARELVERGGNRELLDSLRRPQAYAVLTLLLREAARRLPSWEHALRRELCEVAIGREFWAVAPAGAVADPSDPPPEQRAANAAELHRWAVGPVLAGGDGPVGTVAELLVRLRTSPVPSARETFWLIVEGERPGLPEAVWRTLLKDAYGLPRTPRRTGPPTAGDATTALPDDDGSGYTRRFLRRAGLLIGGLVVAIVLLVAVRAWFG
ncbi:hypothetical protein ACFVJI_32355 [Streptomyces sp. NPDC127584]|uniref:hypothetical protein n=1 Tax=Streptomyces sp. NPDC127584 TaxID=3345403 RepID=UPI00363DAD73